MTEDRDATHEQPEWGIYPEDITPRMYWGARAIITDGRVELLPDRQSFMAEDGESKKAKDAFLGWVNDKALPIVNYHVSVRDTYHIDLTGAKEGYRLIAEDRGSGGYLYIGAYALKPEDVPNYQYGGEISAGHTPHQKRRNRRWND